MSIVTLGMGSSIITQGYGGADFNIKLDYTSATFSLNSAEINITRLTDVQYNNSTFAMTYANILGLSEITAGKYPTISSSNVGYSIGIVKESSVIESQPVNVAVYSKSRPSISSKYSTPSTLSIKGSYNLIKG